MKSVGAATSGLHAAAPPLLLDGSSEVWETGWRGWAVFVLSITFKTEIIFGNLDDEDEGGIYFAGILRSDN